MQLIKYINNKNFTVSNSIILNYQRVSIDSLGSTQHLFEYNS